MSTVKKHITRRKEWKGRPEQELSPNLSLNLGPYNRARKLLILTMVGLSLQISIVTLCAIRILAFIYVSAGTALLTLSLLYTAGVIDFSEHVTIWKPLKQNTMVIWKQQTNEQLQTERYIIGKVIKRELVSAHRLLF
jgi:hypothetical protein